MDQPIRPRARHAIDLGFGDQDRAAALCVGQQSRHQGVRVDDSGRRRQERTGASERRLQRRRLPPGERLQVGDAGRKGGGQDHLKRLQLLIVRGEDQLLGAPVWNATRRAVVIEAPASLDAEGGFQ